MRNYLGSMPLLLALLLSCSEYGDVGQVKFITQHGFSMKMVPAWYLTHAVKRSSWTIHYGFSDNQRCHSSGIVDRNSFEQQLKDSIVKAVQMWLQPLRVKHNDLVKDFALVLKDTTPATDTDLLGMGAEYEIAREQDDDELLRITFNCMAHEGEIPAGKKEYPRSFVQLSTSPQVFMFHYSKPGIDCVENANDSCEPVAERDQREIFPNDKMSGEHMFMITTMLHEMGHAFGLGDVYVETDEEAGKKREGLNSSTGGSERTVGEQPESIMGIASIVGFRHDYLALSSDDEEAIKWLYLQAHENVRLDTCPTDYVEEESTHGCVPRFPLIFAVREGNMDAVSELLENGSIDIDTCDRHGKSALYYAQQGQHGHGQNLVELLEESGANPDIECPVIEQPKVTPTPAPTLTPIAKITKTVLTKNSFNLREQLKEHLSCGTLASHPALPSGVLWLLLLLPALLGGCTGFVE